MLNICLFNPEIPQNTGNIARTCAVTGAHLHLVRPLGFDISESSVRRAGLDYWNDVRISIHSSIGDFLREHGRSEIYFFSRKGSRLFSDVHYTDTDTYLVFGKESTGLSDDILSLYSGRVLRIPMKEGARCLNLSNSAAIAAYEYYRQLGYPGLTMGGMDAGCGEDL